MAKHAEIVKFEAKQQIPFPLDDIDQLHDNALASSESLRDKVAAIPVPKGAPDKEFATLEKSIKRDHREARIGFEDHRQAQCDRRREGQVAELPGH